MKVIQSPVRSAPESKFKVVNATPEAEEAYDLVANRRLAKPSGFVSSLAGMIKGALGAGILGAHVGYSKGGIAVSIAMTILMGVYMTYCLYILVRSAQVLCKRTAIPSMSYSDVGEAAMACHRNPTIRKCSKIFRYTIDVVICIDLFGSCAGYQLIISKTIKQLVENTLEQGMEGTTPDYPHLRVYLLVMMIPCVGICLVRHLDLIGKVSILGNILVCTDSKLTLQYVTAACIELEEIDIKLYLFGFACVIVTVYYSIKVNPAMTGMKLATNFTGLFTFMGMVVFGMSCSGIVMPIENNMQEPSKYGYVLVSGMIFVVLSVIVTGTFGYSAWLDKCDSPITMHFPLTILPQLLKTGIAIMIYITHAVNFFAPFSMTFHYIKVLHKPENHVFWEYFYRAAFTCMITVLAIVFPDVNKIMGFLGTFCLSNMAFIWPCCIYLLVNWERPGLGAYKWRLVKCIILIAIGLVLFSAGTAVSLTKLLSLFGVHLQNPLD